MTADKPTKTGGEWLQSWNPEDPAQWDSKLAWTTLWITTFSLTMCFVAWFLPSAIVPKLNAIGYSFTKGQLYWMAAMPGLSGGLLRLIWMVMPPIVGTRKMVAVTSLLLVAPTLGWGVRVINPTAPYWELMVLAFLAGIGGGVLRVHAVDVLLLPQGCRARARPSVGIELRYSLVQLATPWLIGFSMIGFLGNSQMMAIPGKEPREVWYQNAAFVWIPLMIIIGIVAWFMLKSVPIKANIRQQFDMFSNQDTWWMTILYIMTFGTFSGLAAQFGLLTTNLYGSGNPAIVEGAGATAKLLVEGYNVPDPVKFVFLGPLVGAGARVLFSPLTDKMGGAIWTLISGIGLIAVIPFTMTGLTPDTSSAAALDAGFQKFFWGMLLIFLFAGIGNASTFKQMPMIFERRQAGGVIGWTAAVAAFGPFFFGVGLTTIGVVPFYAIGVVWAIGSVILTWFRYARPGAPKPG